MADSSQGGIRWILTNTGQKPKPWVEQIARKVIDGLTKRKPEQKK